MRKVTVLLVVMMVLGTVQTSFAQSIEVSAWARKNAGKVQSYPWIWAEAKGMVAEARYNFDADKTLTACVGKQIGGDAFNIVPEACGYVGKSKGYGPEVFVFSDTKHFALDSYVQYAKIINGKSFGYTWLQATAEVSHFGFGIASQATKEGTHGVVDVDLGPSVKIHFTKSVTLNVADMFRATKSGRKEQTYVAGFIVNF